MVSSYCLLTDSILCPYVRLHHCLLNNPPRTLEAGRWYHYMIDEESETQEFDFLKVTQSVSRRVIPTQVCLDSRARDMFLSYRSLTFSNKSMSFPCVRGDLDCVYWTAGFGWTHTYLSRNFFISVTLQIG